MQFKVHKTSSKVLLWNGRYKNGIQGRLSKVGPHISKAKQMVNRLVGCNEHDYSIAIHAVFSFLRVELAKCIANPSCAANVACLQTCNDRPDETECQVSPFLFFSSCWACIITYAENYLFDFALALISCRLNVGTCLRTVL